MKSTSSSAMTCLRSAATEFACRRVTRGGVLIASTLRVALTRGARALLLLTQFGRELRAEVLGLEDRAQVDVALLERGALQPLDGLVHVAHLPDPEAGDQFLRLRERPVDHRALLAV